MKTDVIFLGAGASVGAGFPDNRDLANFIIKGLEVQSNVHLLAHLREKLRRTNMLSVDEFCRRNVNPEEVEHMKRVARYALAVYPSATGKPSWSSPTNPYRDFIDTLFFRGEVFPDARFTVVNFNYDGLLAKLLTEAVSARDDNERGVESLDPWRLAPLGGGYYHFPGDIHLGQYDLSEEQLQSSFMHLMPHGTITVLKNIDGVLVSDEAFVYPSDLSADSDIWQHGLTTTAMIDFPWESDKKVSKKHRAQLDLAALAVREADRIHFIGLAGHYLMRHTLSRIFQALSAEQLAAKKWFIATVDSDPQRTFWNICDCLLPRGPLEDRTWWRLHLKASECGDFKRWMYLKPHHNPVDR